MRRRLAALSAFALLLLPFFGHAQAAELLKIEALVDAVRESGNVIVFRHARSDWGSDDDDAWRSELEGCSAQRNLTAAGREQARQIGEAFVRLAIPVGTVKASPFCRTMETAKIAFGEATAQANLRALMPEDEAADRRAAEALAAELLLAPVPGSNTVLVTHGHYLRSLEGFLLAEGGGAAYRPDGKGGYRLLGRFTSDELAELADRLTAASH